MRVDSLDTNHAIVSADGRVLHRSRNLRGLLRYLGGPDAATSVWVTSLDGGAGRLNVRFQSGNSCTTRFASRSVLVTWIAERRNLRGVALYFDGAPAGEVGAAKCDHNGEAIRTHWRGLGASYLVTNCPRCGVRLSRDRVAL
jgi:hypothetical protein